LQISVVGSLPEFGALRAAYCEMQRSAATDANLFQETFRFNEAIDQMLAELVGQFPKRTGHLPDLFCLAKAKLLIRRAPPHYTENRSSAS
jgi:hypothetical protein